MSKATIVSLLPIQLNEFKPGLYPGHFQIPPAEIGDFNILPVVDSIYYVSFAIDNRPPMKITETADHVAASVVTGFVSTSAGLSVDAEPGLFWVSDHLDKKVLAVKHTAELNSAKVKQTKWFTNLVRIADDEWVKSGKMHRSISSLQRAAAKFLNLERDWFIDAITETGPTYCPACKVGIHPAAVICSHCRTVINEAEYKKFKVAS